MSKYIVSVGDIKGEYPCFAWFNTADLQEVIEIFSDVSVDEIKDYTLVLGSDILNEASWIASNCNSSKDSHKSAKSFLRCKDL